MTVLARARNLGPDAKYLCRIYPDDKGESVQAFTSTATERKTFLHKKGFVRVGAYGVKVPPAGDHIDVEFALIGEGRVELADPKMLSVGALEGIYKGRQIVSQDQYDRLAPSERAGLIAKPDRMLSLAGAKFLLEGYIPVSDWLAPVLAWMSIILLILLATLALMAMMRKQWLESERYLLPVARIPIALMDDEDRPQSAFTGIWRNRLMWLGLVISLAWVLLRTANYYNPKVPDLNTRIELKPLVTDLGLQKMLDRVRFEINPIFLSLCIFMELNVLISLVIGYWLFRLQYWLGEASGWNVNPQYPYPQEQSIAAYVMYGAMIIYFTRRYFWNVIKAAIRGEPRGPDELLSYRACVVLLVACFIGCAVWRAAWAWASRGC